MVEQIYKNFVSVKVQHNPDILNVDEIIKNARKQFFGSLSKSQKSSFLKYEKDLRSFLSRDEKRLIFFILERMMSEGNFNHPLR